jgi:hypothetical protein
MKLISGLFGRKADDKPQTQPVQGVEVDENWNRSADASEPVAQQPLDMSQFANETEEQPAAKAEGASVNIWDLDEEDTAEAAPAPQARRSAAKARQNRTRLIGFDKSDGDVVDLFDQDAAAPQDVRSVQFPVGWVYVIDGPGRGHCFTIVAGMSQIGRGEDQAIQLDYGDNAISRNNHAAIVYDPAERSFLLGHGGKANIVRLNGKPVISNETLNDGDKIVIGETTLQLKALCGAGFDWSDTDADDEEHDDVAIA